MLSPEDIDLNDPPFPLTEIDLEILRTPNSLFPLTTWPQLHQIITSNTLEQLKRTPSDLRAYLAWSHNIKNQYGSITNFIIQEKLHWKPISPERPLEFEHKSEIPFANPSDYAVLKNDWPYALDPSITHLLVWSKTPIAVDSNRGDLTPESRRVIEKFIREYFIDAIDGKTENVLWFKNWTSLQSVRGVDHVHVLVRDVPQEVMEKWLVRRDL